MTGLIVDGDSSRHTVISDIIRIVVLTSSREEKDLLESYQLGVNSCIVKPVDFDQFSECLRDIGMYGLLSNTPPKIHAPQ